MSERSWTARLAELRAASDRPAAGRQGDRPSWTEEGRDWPHRETSRFVRAGGLLWHVQQRGKGPVVVLLHGTGAATHSWRGLGPLLAKDFTVIAPDLPGHGFTAMPPRRGLSLPAMAAALDALLHELDAGPAVVVGHSAGAAILARMCLDGRIAPRLLVSLNGAFMPMHGLSGRVLSPMAKLFAATPLVPRLFARQTAADRAVIERLVRQTGSTIEPFGVELYRRLAQHPGHVAGALGMMAHWDLRPLERDLPRLQAALVLVVGGNDRTVRPAQAHRIQALVPDARVVRLPRLGHLAHEERPDEVADLIAREARAAGILPATGLPATGLPAMTP